MFIQFVKQKNTVPFLVLNDADDDGDDLSYLISDNENDELPIIISPEQQKHWYCKLTSWIKIFILMLFLSIVLFAVIYHNITGYLIQIFLIWMRNNLFIGSIVFILLYILCNLLMIPGFFLTIGAGFIFVNSFGVDSASWKGILCAIFIVSISRLIGSTLAFLNGRYLFSDSIHSFLIKYDKFIIINEIIKLQSFKVCFLLRLSPITPYGLLNYLMPITSVPLKYFILGNLGMIPDAITYCLVGASVASIDELSKVHISSNETLLIVVAIMTVTSFCGIIYVGCIAKRELTRLSRIVENDLRKSRSELNKTINCNDNILI